MHTILKRVPRLGKLLLALLRSSFLLNYTGQCSKANFSTAFYFECNLRIHNQVTSPCLAEIQLFLVDLQLPVCNLMHCCAFQESFSEKHAVLLKTVQQLQAEA